MGTATTEAYRKNLNAWVFSNAVNVLHCDHFCNLKMKADS